MSRVSGAGLSLVDVPASSAGTVFVSKRNCALSFKCFHRVTAGAPTPVLPLLFSEAEHEAKKAQNLYFGVRRVNRLLYPCMMMGRVFIWRNLRGHKNMIAQV